MELNGAVTYTSTSGDIVVKSAVGSGSYRSNNSGNLKVTYTEVTGDLSFFNKNGGIELTLPQDLEFEFEATTKNGSVSTSFQGSISIDGRTTRGTVGNTPTATVKTETNNGNIILAAATPHITLHTFFPLCFCSFTLSFRLQQFWKK